MGKELHTSRLVSGLGWVTSRRHPPAAQGRNRGWLLARVRSHTPPRDESLDDSCAVGRDQINATGEA
ncbi:hypothetical protein AKJ09_04854 [Labilithrix luteola]|uniref:Uncharacterized protein n=1 Tax=Labilithrix luteola TaxID=1391654 RepID=A0A0K1PXC9_9BACT|nr:hypothetical protein AKJ09_04854 [Labilithrix luteola]